MGGLSRREFLKFSALATAGILNPNLDKSRIPETFSRIKEVYSKIPSEYLDSITKEERLRIFNYLLHQKDKPKSKRNYKTIEDINIRYHRDPKISSPFKCYLGDIHSHSLNSDGWHSPNHSFLYAKKMGLDFTAISDHSEILTPDEWLENLQVTSHHHKDGEFVTLPAYEYTNVVDGHYNIYMLPKEIKEIPYEAVFAYYNFFMWRNEYTNENQISSYSDLAFILKQIKGHANIDDVIAVPHHPAWKLSPTNWSLIDNEISPIAEGYSKHGNSMYPSSFPGFFDQIAVPLTDNSVIYALDSGLELGIISSTDTHGSRAGAIQISHPDFVYPTYQGGLIGVLISEEEDFNRRTLFDALKNKRTYGSTILGLEMYFAKGDNILGSSIIENLDPFIMEVYAPKNSLQEGDEDITAIEIIKDGKIVYHEENISNPHYFNGEWTDPNPYESEKSNYHLRIRTNDRDLGWSSPIFVKRE